MKQFLCFSLFAFLLLGCGFFNDLQKAVEESGLVMTPTPLPTACDDNALATAVVDQIQILQ